MKNYKNIFRYKGKLLFYLLLLLPLGLSANKAFEKDSIRKKNLRWDVYFSLNKPKVLFLYDKNNFEAVKYLRKPENIYNYKPGFTIGAQKIRKLSNTFDWVTGIQLERFDFLSDTNYSYSWQGDFTRYSSVTLNISIGIKITFLRSKKFEIGSYIGSGMEIGTNSVVNYSLYNNNCYTAGSNTGNNSLNFVVLGKAPIFFYNFKKTKLFISPYINYFLIPFRPQFTGYADKDYNIRRFMTLNGISIGLEF